MMWCCAASPFFLVEGNARLCSSASFLFSFFLGRFLPTRFLVFFCHHVLYHRFPSGCLGFVSTWEANSAGLPAPLVLRKSFFLWAFLVSSLSTGVIMMFNVMTGEMITGQRRRPDLFPLTSTIVLSSSIQL